MTQKQIIFNFIQRSFDLSKTSQDWYVFDCPFCKKSKKMAYQPDYELVKCWVCGYRKKTFKFICDFKQWTFNDILTNLGIRLSNDLIPYSVSDYELTTAVSSDVTLPLGYTSLFDNKSLCSINAQNFLKQRNIDIEYADFLGFGVTEEFDKDDNYYGYLIMPFKRLGKLVYYIARSYTNTHFLRYKNPSFEKTNLKKSDVIWNEDALSFHNEVFITEGVFSALSIGDNAVATLGKSASQTQIKKFIESDCETFIICYDGGCYMEMYKLFLQLFNYKKLKVLYLPEGKDPNDLGLNYITDLVKKTEISTFAEKFTLLRYHNKSLYNKKHIIT